MSPPFPSKFAVGDWVELHWQYPGQHGVRQWGIRWAQIAEVEWWEYDPAVREQAESWGYCMAGYAYSIYEDDIIRKLSLLEIIAVVSKEDGE